MMSPSRRLAILAEGSFTPLDAKTASGMLRYRPEEVVAVIDSTRAGQTAAACVGVGGDVPVVSDVEAAIGRGARALMIGIAPKGGGLPASWRDAVRRALENGWDVWSGLHVFLSDDPEFAALAAAHGGRIHDVRCPPSTRPLGTARAAEVQALVVLTVGTDCNVGKMTTALELVRGLDGRGVRATFVATGQTGIFIAGSGVATDAVPSDFVAGIVERQVLDASRDADVVVVEGQGALHHPGYSGVTLGLLHGACPAAMVLCHDATRTRLRARDDDTGTPLPSLAVARAAYEAAAAWVRPAHVIGAALNTSRLGENEAREVLAAATADLGLPAVDPVRFSVAPLVDVVLGARDARRRPSPFHDPETSCA